MLLMPSKQESGAVTQMYALRYGTVPIVRSTGVLNDTVKAYDSTENTGTGITFSGYDADQLFQAILTALDAYRDQQSWQALMRRGMQQDFSWDTVAGAYEQLYQKAVDLATV